MKQVYLKLLLTAIHVLMHKCASKICVDYSKTFHIIMLVNMFTNYELTHFRTLRSRLLYHCRLQPPEVPSNEHKRALMAGIVLIYQSILQLISASFLRHSFVILLLSRSSSLSFMLNIFIYLCILRQYFSLLILVKSTVILLVSFSEPVKRSSSRITVSSQPDFVIWSALHVKRASSNTRFTTQPVNASLGRHQAVEVTARSSQSCNSSFSLE